MSKKKLAALILASSFFIMTPGVLAAEINEEAGNTTEANITVKGNLGADNTQREAGIEEGHDDWINVTLDTSTIFYNLKTDTSIKSPKYNITNKSARPVKVTIKSFNKTNDVDLTPITALDLKTTDGVTQNLVTNGTLATQWGDFVTLGANDGNLTKDGSETAPVKVDYNFTGSVSAPLNISTTPSFNLELKFIPVTWK